VERSLWGRCVAAGGGPRPRGGRMRDRPRPRRSADGSRSLAPREEPPRALR